MKSTSKENHTDDKDHDANDNASNSSKEESEKYSDSGSDSGSDSDDEDVEISNEEIRHAIALATEAATKKFGWKMNANTASKPVMNPSSSTSTAITTSTSNPLSEMIPGYVAPMTLDSSSLDQYKKPQSNFATRCSAANKLMKPNKSLLLSSASTKAKQMSANNAGSGWFNFEATSNSAAIQADIAIIRNRNYLNPKKFYKSSDFHKKGSQLVQLGTVIEGSMESIYSNRMSKKERKETLLEEVMGEVFASKDDYVKKKYTNMQRDKSDRGRMAKRKMSKKSRGSRKRGKR